MKDPYVYEGTNVLINNLNIQDIETLEKAESDLVALAANNLRYSDFEINSIFDGLKIHKYLFDRLYKWAGEARTIDIYKGESLLGGYSIDYVFASYIKQALEELNEEFVRVKWDELSNNEKIRKDMLFHF